MCAGECFANAITELFHMRDSNDSGSELKFIIDKLIVYSRTLYIIYYCLIYFTIVLINI